MSCALKKIPIIRWRCVMIMKRFVRDVNRFEVRACVVLGCVLFFHGRLKKKFSCLPSKIRLRCVVRAAKCASSKKTRLRWRCATLYVYNVAMYSSHADVACLPHVCMYALCSQLIKRVGIRVMRHKVYFLFHVNHLAVI